MEAIKVLKVDQLDILAVFEFYKTLGFNETKNIENQSHYIDL